MTARSIFQVFDQYQKARISFVQTVGELALRSQNVEYLRQAGALELLQSLLSDTCVQIQQCAAIAIGRMVHCDVRLAKQVINRNCLPLLLRDIERQNKYYKRAVLFVIRSLTGHNEEIASVVVSSGGLEALVLCLEDFEPMVKQGAVWAIGHIARHSLALAQNVVDIGAVPLVILCLQEPELTIKQVSVSAIADVAKHGVDLAQNVVDAGAVPHLVRNLGNQDEKLKRNVLHALSCIATHSNDLAEVVVEAEIFPSVLIHMSHACPVVRRNAASLVRDIVKHSLELTQLVVNTGGIGALMEALHHQSEESKVPCITAVGYIAGHSDQLAMSVLGCNGVDALTGILRASSDDATQAVTVWTLGQIGKHSPEHAKAIGIANAFPLLLNFYLANTSSEDLKYKCKTTLKQCLQKCIMLSALEPLLYVAPINILKYVLGQFSKVLPNDPKARRLFVTSGGLKKVQEIQAEPGSRLMEYITIINACFPEEIVRYYSPNYPETLLDAVEQYSPQIMTMLRETKLRDSDVQADVSVALDAAYSQTDT
ncbi:hypothetical protein PPYR_02756 [Photinus pyralis]|uniref:Sperm-associated antigen 6 n=2 Tax=Photinus pyralis TaxID=7054 RepID=A0A5N4A0X4_PHOPY|nr:sperm-associated antigen 6-like isoform X2 [Photinus pyralis]KAB0790956.1 hypothetical protein PPYR_02756 [Photinus pyralis]